MEITALEFVVAVIAIAGIRQTFLADRITQWPRYKVIGLLDRAGGFIPYHTLFLIGCVACLPFWIGVVIYSLHNYEWTWHVATVFALRQAAQWAMIYFQDDENRDYPKGVFFPPDTPAQRRAEAANEAELERRRQEP